MEDNITVRKDGQLKRRLSNNKSVDFGLYSYIHMAALKSCDDKIMGQRYTARNICGEHYWVKLTPWQQRAAGMCIAQLVLEKQVLYDFVEEIKPGHPQSYYFAAFH